MLAKKSLGSSYFGAWADFHLEALLDKNDADDDYRKFIETFDTLYNECVPLYKKGINYRKKGTNVTMDH